MGTQMTRGIMRAVNTWQARIGYQGKTIIIGNFKTREDAEEARLEKEIELYGDTIDNIRERKIRQRWSKVKIDDDLLYLREEMCFFDRDGYVSINKNGRFIHLHRFIMSDILSDGLVVDHINGDTKDNRRSNLRVCTFAENMLNQKIRKNNTSGTTGVCWNKRREKWVSVIQYRNKSIFLGAFKDKDEAISARKDAEKKYFGEFARETKEQQ